MCLFCARYHRDNADAFTCDAFPDGIPEPLFLSQHDQRIPFPGDGGLQFELLPGKERDFDRLLSLVSFTP